jgi:hypothetical protein
MMRAKYFSLILVSAIFVGCAGTGQKPAAKSGASVASSAATGATGATGEDLFGSFNPHLPPLDVNPATSSRFDFEFAEVVVCRIAPPRPVAVINQPVDRGHPDMPLIDDVSPGNGN